MKKFLILAVVMYATSCSNPEDRATGNPDSTTFNQSGNEKDLNTSGGGDDIGNQSHAKDNDTSSSPSTLKQNAGTRTQGTNREYKTAGDSAHQQ